MYVCSSLLTESIMLSDDKTALYYVLYIVASLACTHGLFCFANDHFKRAPGKVKEFHHYSKNCNVCIQLTSDGTLGTERTIND